MSMFETDQTIRAARIAAIEAERAYIDLIDARVDSQLAEILARRPEASGTVTSHVVQEMIEGASPEMAEYITALKPDDVTIAVFAPRGSLAHPIIVVGFHYVIGEGWVGSGFSGVEQPTLVNRKNRSRSASFVNRNLHAQVQDLGMLVQAAGKTKFQ